MNYYCWFVLFAQFFSVELSAWFFGGIYDSNAEGSKDQWSSDLFPRGPNNIFFDSPLGIIDGEKNVVTK